MISCTDFKLRRKKLSTSDLTYPPCCQLRHSGAVLTSNLRRTQIPRTMVIPAGQGGLNQESVALCYQIVVIDRQRLQRQLGTLSSSYLQQLEDVMRYTLDLT